MLQPSPTLPSPEHGAPSSTQTRRTAQLTVRFLSVLSFVTVAITALAGTAQASPTTAAPVKYTVSSTPTSMTITVDNGTIATADGKLSIRNNAGAEVFRMPLAYRMEYRQFPIDAHTVGKTATLIPSKDAARSTPVAKAEVDALRIEAAKQQEAKSAADPNAPKTKKERDDRALAEFNSTLATGMTISNLVGLIVGAIVGGFIGCVVTLFAACAGVVAGATLGSIVGLILGGGGTLIYAAVQYFNTVNSPFVPPKTASTPQG
ncbi:hypothetical protein [Gordonia rhizosphera]|uniref:DUF8020 domain-containing protein n=1 Tax=Gordonia rhizosphera NBRC 16068 TaxID=1108045 RepID=K6W2W7_9ACTN|nr:hypothetical protein [Gordonia rhizosphera]GAB88071.1 hypothetical protein GORHZ_001_00030 [Gordonia rhizosphera NBRC 16068]